MNEKQIKHVGKSLAYILRHAPETAGISLDPEGWAPVPAITSNLLITEAELQHVCDTDTKGRYNLDIPNGRIRANQGHSIPIDLSLTPIIPPFYLYHGTSHQVVSTILREGLLPRSRQYVHLSIDVPTAIEVGKRRDASPIILEIDTMTAQASGTVFFKSENGVFLTKHVPGKFLSILKS